MNFRIWVAILLWISVSSKNGPSFEGVDPFSYTLYPLCSEKEPLEGSKHFEIVPEEFFPESYKYHVCHHSSSSPSSEVVDTQVFKINSPYAYVYGKTMGRSYEQDGPDYISIKVYDGKGNLVSLNPTPRPVYWDFRYSNLRYTSLKFEETDIGEVVVTPVANDTSLDTSTKYYYYVARLFPSKEVDHLHNYQLQGKKQLKWVFNSPSIIYFEVFGETAEFRSHSTYFAIRCCSENKTCPDVDPSFKSTNVYTLKSVIPNDKQLPILQEKITIIQDTTLSLSLGGLNPDTIDIMFLSPNLFLDTSFSHIYNITSTNFTKSSNFYRIAKKGTQWSYRNRYIPIAFHFAKTEVVTATFRVENGRNQQMTLVLKNVPQFSKNLPIRLSNSFEWVSISNYRSVRAYANFGFNMVPMVQTLEYWKDLSTKFFNFTVEQRSKNRDWHIPNPEPSSHPYFQMKLCLEISLFGSANTYNQMYSLFYNILSAPSIVPKYFPTWMNETQKRLEEQMWQNAIDFHKKTKILDISYNGYFYQRALQFMTEVLNYTLPECVNFDIEHWSSNLMYIKTANYSQNLKNRLKPAESVSDAMVRIIGEYLNDIKNGVYQAGYKSGKDVVMPFYGVQSLQNQRYGPATFEQYDEADFVPQPSLYRAQKNIEVMAMTMRHYKQYFSTSSSPKNIIPMPSPGTYGKILDSALHFEGCIHLFGNGATGIMHYGIDGLIDMQFYLDYQRCFMIFSPFEDILLDGKIGFHDFSNVDERLVLSSMKKDDSKFTTYLVSISVKQDFSQSIEEFTSIFFELICEKDIQEWKIIDLGTEKDVTNCSSREKNTILFKWDSLFVPTVLQITIAN